MKLTNISSFLLCILAAVVFVNYSVLAVPTQITITNTTGTSGHYSGTVTLHFPSYPDMQLNNLPAGATIISIPESPISVTVSGSTAYSGAGVVSFSDGSTTGFVYHDGVNVYIGTIK